MKSSEQGMAGRLARFEANINKGYNHRLALSLASNEPGDLPMGKGRRGRRESGPVDPDFFKPGETIIKGHVGGPKATEQEREQYYQDAITKWRAAGKPWPKEKK